MSKTEKKFPALNIFTFSISAEYFDGLIKSVGKKSKTIYLKKYYKERHILTSKKEKYFMNEFDNLR